MRKIFKLFILCLLILFVSACSSEPTSKGDNIQELVNKVWGEEIYFPLDEEHPIGIIYTEYLPDYKDGEKVPFGEEPWMINIMYFSKDKEARNGNEQIDHWKEDDPV